MPERASVHVNVMVSGPVLMPFTGAGETVAEIVGAVLSILTVSEAVVLFPVFSFTVPVTPVDPSAVTVTGGSQLAPPESASLVVNETVTLPLFQPAAFGVGDGTAVMVGGVLS